MDTARKPPGLLLAGIYCHDYSPDQAGAYVRVDNAGQQPADLANMMLEWDGVPLVFPAGKPLPPQGSVYIAWNAAGFQRLLTRTPDYTVTPVGGIPGMTAGTGSGAPHALQPAGGTVRLLLAPGKVLDAFVWGTGALVAGWTGAAAEPVDQGVVYQRAIREESLGQDSPGDFVTDVGTAAAWRQGTDWLPRRQLRAGQSEWSYPVFTAPGATAFACPDSSFDVITQFLDGAAHSLDINIYLFTQAALADRVGAAVERGVKVRLLLEGEPYGGIPPSDRQNIGRLQQMGVDVRVLHAAADGFKRYHYDHAKYAVADGTRSLIMSDNWTNSSVPSEPAAGNRGWGIVVDGAPLAAHLTAIFEGDWNPESTDSVAFDPAAGHHLPLSGAQPAVARPSDAPPPDVPPPAEGGRRPLPDPFAPAPIAGSLQVTPFVAPEHALLATRAVCGLIRSATQTLDVEQDTLQLYWGFGTAETVETAPNLFLSEVVAAARRGVRVRVLMDGAYLNAQDPRDNSKTQAWLQALATNEKLPLESRILDHGATGMVIHDKGLIVDGRAVLISSINWTENSPLSNRELGLVVESEAAAAFFGQVFERDWGSGK